MFVVEAAWLAGLLPVTFFARRVFRQSALSFDSQHSRFFISGSWAPLAVIMAIFFTKYALAVVQGRMGTPVGPEAAAGLSMLLGAFSGYFVARALALVAVARRPGNSSKPTPLRGAA